MQNHAVSEKHRVQFPLERQAITQYGIIAYFLIANRGIKYKNSALSNNGNAVISLKGLERGVAKEML